jgi:hypothetical protein
MRNIFITLLLSNLFFTPSVKSDEIQNLIRCWSYYNIAKETMLLMQNYKMDISIEQIKAVKKGESQTYKYINSYIQQNTGSNYKILDQMEKVNNDHRSENQKLQDFLPYSKKHRIFCRELLSNY